MTPQKIIQFHSVPLGSHLVEVDISETVRLRKVLLEKGLIGMLDHGEWKGYHYGNISVRLQKGMLISSSQTSGNIDATLDVFAFVENYDHDRFSVKWRGVKPPSSETSLHWSIYSADSKVNAVIHAHIVEQHPAYWHMAKFFEKKEFPLTHSKSKTREIGDELKKLVLDKKHKNIIGMLNHDGGFGLIATGADLNGAFLKLIEFYDALR